MFDLEYQKDQTDETIPRDVIDRRSGTDRRKKSALGFAYISTIGWICSREQIRRKADPEVFAGYEP